MTGRRASVLLPRQVAVAAAIRLFALVTIGIPTFVTGDTTTLMTVVLLAVVWAGATSISLVARLPAVIAVILESAVVGFVCAVSIEQLDTLQLTALAVTPLIGSLRLGATGVAVATLSQAAVMSLAALRADPGWAPDQVVMASFGLVLGVGVGMVGTFRHSVVTRSDQLTPYRDARTLLQQLLELSDDLTAGLDPVSIAEQVGHRLRAVAGLESAVVQVPRGEEFVPLLSAPASGSDPETSHALHQAWATREIVVSGRHVAVPLGTDAGMVAVVTGHLDDPEHEDRTTRALTSLADELAGSALRLDTALLFSAVRERATTEERQRLAREVHDGIAQEVASLGYFVDAMAAGAQDGEQTEQLTILRDAISTVVAEIRRTVYNLRSEQTAGLTLGQQLEALAVRVTAHTPLVVTARVDESEAPLLQAVENELFRIAQEALNNAVKHSGADRVQIDAVIRAPEAWIRVRDNGDGLRERRGDSHGLRIMTERARRIGGEIAVESVSGDGVTVSVSVGSLNEPTSTWETPEKEPTDG